MKYQGKITLVATALLLFIGCSDDPVIDPTEINIEGTSDITETGFTVSWSVDGPQLKSLRLDVSETSDFSDYTDSISISDPASTEQSIGGLKGATRYYYRLRGIKDDASNSEIFSSVREVITRYKTDRITFTTSDGVKLAGHINYLESNTGERPAIIFIHPYRDQQNVWLSHDFYREHVARGYVCMTFYSRGHGSSDPWPILSFGQGVDCGPLVENTEIVFQDVLAAIAYIRNSELVNPDKIGLVGLSAGAVNGLNASDQDGISCIVALSAFRLWFKDIAYENALFIAAENHMYYMCEQMIEKTATTAQILYSRSQEPRKVMIIPNSQTFGTELLEEDGVQEAMESWIEERLGS